MRICFVLSEIFAWGKFGGFGSMVRFLARGLTERGLEVYAIVPRRPGQKPQESLDGFTVLSHPGWSVFSSQVYRQVDADIYHSQEATLATLAALQQMPDRKHLITSIDPWTTRDWWVEFKYDVLSSPTRGLVYPLMWLYYSPMILRYAARHAQAVFSQASYLVQKVQQIYRLSKPPRFLPNPYAVPKRPLEKAKQPTVCYLARWDPRKRPEIFFELAKRFPKVRFVALGKAHNRRRDAGLRKKYSEIPNLQLVGFVNPFESDRLQHVLEKSWIMINTAAREGLPAAYIESAAHRCAILSAIDADGFASRGGYHIKATDKSNQPPELGGEHVTVDDYATGLEWLLENDRWREQAQAGHEYVLQVHDQNRVVDNHLAIYSSTLKE